MKEFNELTKVGKYKRCKKVLAHLGDNLSNKQSLKNAFMKLHMYEIHGIESYVNGCREELLKVVSTCDLEDYLKATKQIEILI